MPSGGRRPGAGRPKGSKNRNTLTLEGIQGKSLEEIREDAKYALGLFNWVQRNERLPLDLRLKCAEQVANRYYGKPTQHTELSGTDELRVTLIGGINAEDGETPPGMAK